MGRYSTGSTPSYGHDILFCSDNLYVIKWKIDRAFPGHTKPITSTYLCATPFAGAKRFCKKHGLTMPKE